MLKCWETNKLLCVTHIVVNRGAWKERDSNDIFALCFFTYFIDSKFSSYVCRSTSLQARTQPYTHVILVLSLSYLSVRPEEAQWAKRLLSLLFPSPHPLLYTVVLNLIL